MRSTRHIVSGFVALTVLLASTLAAEEGTERARIVVVDFSVSKKHEAKAPGLGLRVVESVDLALGSRFDVVPREEVRGAMRDLSITLADCMNYDKKAAQLGRHLEASRVLVGRASTIEEVFVLNIRLVDVATAGHGEWSSVKYARTDQLAGAVYAVLEAAGLLPSWRDIGTREYDALARHEKALTCARAYAQAENDPGLQQAAHDWFVERGENEWARKVLEKVLERDPECDWANQRMGRRNLQEIYERIPKDPLLEEYPIEAYEYLLALKRNAPKWGAEVEYKRAEKSLRAVIAHLQKLKNDALYLDEYTIRRWVRVHPVYGEYECESAALRPYVVFVEHTGKDAEAQVREAKAILDRDSRMLVYLYREFHRMLGKRFKLPLLAEREWREERLLKVFVFFDEAALEEHLEDLEDDASPPGLGDHYRHVDQWVLLCESRGAASRSEEGECSVNTNKVFRAGAEQLLHFYRRIVTARETGKFVPWPSARGRAYWFDSGFADLLGTAKPKGAGSWELMAPNRQLLNEWKEASKAELPEWSLEDLLKVMDREEMREEAAMMAELGDVERMSMLFRAQAWSFCHYLWFFRGGRYRDEFLEYIGEELKGESGPNVLEKALWGDKESSWSTLERDWHAHVERLWSKMKIH